MLGEYPSKGLCSMKIVKLSEEACRALEQLGVPFEQIGVTTTKIEIDQGVRPLVSPDQPLPRSLGSEESSHRPNHKAIGAENRRRYLQQLRQNGLTLEHERRTAYLTPRGNRV